MKIFFGTYTRRQSKGIYAADFSPETGQFSQLQITIEEPSPTYLAFSKEGYLYSVGATNEGGGIAAFTPQFQHLNHVVEDGAPLCHVFVDEERGLVYGANYHKGQITSYKIEENGSLALVDQKNHLGCGSHENQASAHAHFVGLTPDNYLVTCDLGSDQVITYLVEQDGQLQELERYHSQEGAGPRHIVFHPRFKTAYLICELNSTIEVLVYDGVGQFERMQVISTLPSSWTAFNGPAAIRLSKDGRFLYASNRGHDSIAVFQVLADGSLELVEIQDSLGKTPRDFILSPDEDFLIAVHQDSDNVAVFSRHPETGKLSPLHHDFIVPEAVCVVFEPNIS